MGRNLPFGSTEEALAEVALQRRRDIHYLTVVSVVNAIIYMGSALTGSKSGADTLRKSLDSLKMVLFPDEEAKLEKRAKEVKEMVLKETSKGPLNFKVVDDGGKKAKRRRQRR